ncbi:unnamed protein product [Arabis nemorensis]|uniref:Uncharacterized protein n=1 Tax=Arabis nemorensis TaxID=586526 RepID=A0A565BA46_9BRAS|nr:unnamed protein product [Arabis nemorensis]
MILICSMIQNFQSEAVRGHQGARRGSHTISIIRSTKDMGKIGPDWIDRMIERDMEDARRIQDEIERVMKAEKTQQFISKEHKIEGKAAFMGNSQQHESTKGNGAQGLWEL